MSPFRKVCFSVVTVLLVASLIEGTARAVWWYKAAQAFDVTRQRGEELLRNDLIHFMKEPHGLYAFSLKPGLAQGALVINEEGFVQRDRVPRARVADRLRLAALGESTTMGNGDVDLGCYPGHLRRLLAESLRSPNGVEVINAGVPGWFSDQVALRAENQIAAFRPDVVVLYVGWNDFQAYVPNFGPFPASAFDSWMRGSRWHEQAAWRFKSVALLAALYQKYSRRPAPASVCGTLRETPPAETYRWFLRNLDRIVAAFRRENPEVRIALCTLVGRWPMMSPEEFARNDGHVDWMTAQHTTVEEAADHLARFNDLIRTYAAEHGLVLIDAARIFEPLDRRRLQWDFAHMHNEGYELLAEVMYEELRRAGVLAGDPRPRYKELLAKYQR
jgi:lysophospholipase L1-like esterase